MQQAIYEHTLARYLAPILPFLDDASVSEIMINGAGSIFIEQRGNVHRTNARFPSEDALGAAVKHVAQYVGRELNDDHPVLDARLPDGSRVHAVLPPLSRNGITVAIRKFSRRRQTLEGLVEQGTLSTEAAEFLARCVWSGKNLIVSGGTGSGKTSLLNVLSGMIRPQERVIVIEDASELKLQGEHVLYFETRQPDREEKGAVTIRDLFRSALRLRPDRIIIGETRGPEALDLIQAMISGHRGSMSTLHATTSWDALYRLETMALMADVRMPLEPLRNQVASAVQVVVQIERMFDGTRRVVEIAEVLPKLTRSTYQLVPLFKLLCRTGQSGQSVCQLRSTGTHPSFLAQLVRPDRHPSIRAQDASRSRLENSAEAVTAP